MVMKIIFKEFRRTEYSLEVRTILPPGLSHLILDGCCVKMYILPPLSWFCLQNKFWRVEIKNQCRQGEAEANWEAKGSKLKLVCPHNYGLKIVTLPPG